MTIAAARTQARRYSRVSSTQATDAQVNLLIQDAIDEFANDVDGFPTEEYLSIAARFDTKTNYAVRITVVGGNGEMSATDVLITGTARDDTTGTIVAADFQTTLQAATGESMTVAWADFAFTIDTLDATSIAFAAPTTVTYVDARELLGLPAAPTLSDYSFTGSFPEDCTMEATIPSDAFQIERVEWDQKTLEELPPRHFMSPESSGDPAYYRVRGREIRLSPSPTTQGLFHIEYRGAPAELAFSGYQELGLSDCSDESPATGITAQEYTIGVSINGATSADITFTVASDITWAAIIILMNAQTTGATWSIVGGDIRLTSDAVDGVSTIAIVAGGATDFLDGVTAFSAVDTAVAGDTDLPSEIPSTFHQFVPRLVASKLMAETQEKLSDKEYIRYMQGVNKYKRKDHAKSTAIPLGGRLIRFPEVTI